MWDASFVFQKAYQFRRVVEEDNYKVARDKFGAQKGEIPITTRQLGQHTDQVAISSDMYFGRGNYDPQASSEAKTRLKEFSGATAISSNAYFGRPEEDEDEAGPSAQQGGDAYMDNDTLAGLERNVRDAAGRFMANPDVQNITDQIRQGALKVSPSAMEPFWPRLDLGADCVIAF